ncbi:hypothetical protein A8C56_13400 [Niabella ginsenosidivorans]|uniref:Anti-sigma factor n=1 Tax=Niabella ginsenosidivorans TaxID=1176587 RepID=A0A1A9I569_9BACT|nr:FecR family protein [Niabella ginsenosidivorans]ANH81840.1 hypothetical protein A8C56_13400 [Niabella ginsenosidivorans]
MSRIHDLLNKFALGISSREEFDELMSLLNEERYGQEIRQALKDIYGTLDTEVFSDIQIGKKGNLIEPQNALKGLPGGKKYWRKRIAAAAAIVLPLGFIAFLLFTKNNFLHNQNSLKTVQMSTQAESKTSLILPDGSKVWLNSYSTITYNTGFNDGKREVTLVGEALFDVKHDSLHPFVVHTKNFNVTDMGTVFNVQSYPEDPHATASLISGSIEITFKEKEKQREKIVLVPNQKITVSNSSGAEPDAVNEQLLVKSSILPDPQTNIIPDTAWMAKKIIFKDISFYDLALQMQRRYSIKMVFKKAQIGAYKFTGRFNDETPDEALRELQAIAPFTYSKEKDSVYIIDK